MHSYVWSLQEKIRRLEKESGITPPPNDPLGSHATPTNSDETDEQLRQKSVTYSRPTTSVHVVLSPARTGEHQAESIIDDNSPDVLDYSKRHTMSQISQFSELMILQTRLRCKRRSATSFLPLSRPQMTCEVPRLAQPRFHPEKEPGGQP